MPRVISFIVLLAIILLVGAIFFQVMAQFIVPLFLACVLLVVFQPLHHGILDRMPRWPRLSALLTTVLILLVVLLPLIWLGWQAYTDFHELLSRPAAAATQSGVPQLTAPPSKPEPAMDEGDLAPSLVEQDKKVELSSRLKDFVNNFLDRIGVTAWNLDDANSQRIVSSATTFAGNFVLNSVKSAIGILIGLVIMVIALYYFLADGPEMIRTLMHLSPLDSKYEKELLARFAQVSRAVVIATLLSAVLQGALAGIGYYFALPAEAPIFLLTAATIVMALVPFFGAAAVWIFVCLWVYAYGEPTTAVILAVYCTIIVSGIDNVIKPLVLHGQSNLHPLLALLSILGGVQALGPVGILIGPMLVSFLQALLNMLRKELELFGGIEDDEHDQLATSTGQTTATPEATEPAAQFEAKGVESTSPDGRQAKAAKSSPSPAGKAGQPAGSRRPKRKRGR